MVERIDSAKPYPDPGLITTMYVCKHKIINIGSVLRLIPSLKSHATKKQANK